MYSPASVTLAQLAEFDEIVDVRSESEFADDHIASAVNCPVLNDSERSRVGTLYKQVSPFDAKKTGAALVSRNIAHHLDATFGQRSRSWRPLVYCWRGGSRSGAMVHVLQQVGWKARQLDGGYKAYRRTVIAELDKVPQRFKWRVVCGLTGSGKSRLLRALARTGAQVLDLEMLAAHRGSVLGDLPGSAQPPQKMFESLVWNELRKLDPARPVFVEAESKRIGAVRVPEALIAAMWKGSCLKLQASTALRVAMLKEEYRHFLDDPASLGRQLNALLPLHGKARIDSWKALAAHGDWDVLVQHLLEYHYDPAYTRSTSKRYPHYATAPALELIGASDDAFDEAAARYLKSLRVSVVR